MVQIKRARAVLASATPDKPVTERDAAEMLAKLAWRERSIDDIAVVVHSLQPPAPLSATAQSHAAFDTAASATEAIKTSASMAIPSGLAPICASCASTAIDATSSMAFSPSTATTSATEVVSSDILGECCMDRSVDLCMADLTAHMMDEVRLVAHEAKQTSMDGAKGQRYHPDCNALDDARSVDERTAAPNAVKFDDIAESSAHAADMPCVAAASHAKLDLSSYSDANDGLGSGVSTESEQSAHPVQQGRGWRWLRRGAIVALSAAVVVGGAYALGCAMAGKGRNSDGSSSNAAAKRTS